MPYVGNDWNDFSPGENRTIAIDFGPYVQEGDSLSAQGIVREFYPVVGTVPGYTSIPIGNPYLIGTIVNQEINQPPGVAAPGNKYLLGFKCNTANGNTIELWSYFRSISAPSSST